jgi:hypothetical protein
MGAPSQGIQAGETRLAINPCHESGCDCTAVCLFLGGVGHGAEIALGSRLPEGPAGEGRLILDPPVSVPRAIWHELVFRRPCQKFMGGSRRRVYPSANEVFSLDGSPIGWQAARSKRGCPGLFAGRDGSGGVEFAVSRLARRVPLAIVTGFHGPKYRPA